MTTREDYILLRKAHTIRDVGDVSGAINSLLNGLGMNVADRFADLFENAVN